MGPFFCSEASAEGRRGYQTGTNFADFCGYVPFPSRAPGLQTGNSRFESWLPHSTRLPISLDLAGRSTEVSESQGRALIRRGLRP